MSNEKSVSNSTGVKCRNAYLYGFLALITAAMVVSTGGGRASSWAADNATPPTGIMTLRETVGIGERFIRGLMDGSVEPEAGFQIVNRLFIDMSDGVLTEEEIGSILKQVKRACDALL